jgi:hypothetical protein
MKAKRTWWVVAAGIVVLLGASSALGSSVVHNKRFQRTFLCVNMHNGLI